MLDTHYDTTGAHARGERGPAEKRYDQFPPLQGMVFGAFGEMSRDTYTLLDQLAEAGATKYEGDMLCASRQHAKGVLRYLMRSSWYFAAVREHAWLLKSSAGWSPSST